MLHMHNSFRSSFDANKVIRPGKSALTVLSGSSWAGSHASMWLEHFLPTSPNPETRMFDVAVEPDFHIRDLYAQRWTGLDWFYENNQAGEYLKKCAGDLTDGHYRSYDITDFQRNKLMLAITRFSAKITHGRYKYSHVGGGALGWVFSMPGRRGVNCADFCLKVLNEAGIGNRHNLLINTPIRMAKLRG